MITRRRRQGSETEQQLIADSESHQQVVKGPSSGLLWSGSESSFNQPAFYFVPPGEPGSTANAPNVAGLNFLDEQTKKTANNSDAMALASLSNSAILSSSNASSRDRTAEFLSAVRSFQSRSTNGMIVNHSASQSKNHEQHQQYSEFMKVAK